MVIVTVMVMVMVIEIVMVMMTEMAIVIVMEMVMVMVMEKVVEVEMIYGSAGDPLFRPPSAEEEEARETTGCVSKLLRQFVEVCLQQ